MGLRQSRWGLLAIGLLLTSVQANGASRVVFVQPIQVRGDDGTGPANPDRVLFEAAADKILAQADVELRFLPWRTYDSSAAQAITTSAQFNSLIDGSNHGQHANKNVCNMWFVQTIAGGSCGAPTSPQILGCGKISGNGTVIADLAINTDDLDTMSHELGHNFGLGHTDFGAGPPANLMTAGGTSIHARVLDDIFPDGQAAGQLTQQQIDKIVGNSTVKTIYDGTWNVTLNGQFNWGSAGNWTNAPVVNAFPDENYDVGVFNVSVPFGSIYLDRDIRIRNYNQSGGTVSTIRGFNQGPAYNLNVGKELRWTRGTMAGKGETVSEGTLAINVAVGQSPPTLSGRTLRARGEATFSGGGSLAGSGGAALVLEQHSTITDDTSILKLSSGPAPTLTIEETGILVKTGGAPGNQSAIDWNIVNRGGINVSTGNLVLSGGGNGPGSFYIQDASLRFTRGFDIGGDLAGQAITQGIVDFAGGVVNIAGRTELLREITVQVRAGSVNFNGPVAGLGKQFNLTNGFAHFTSDASVPTLNLDGRNFSAGLILDKRFTVTNNATLTGGCEISGPGSLQVQAPLQITGGVVNGVSVDLSQVTTLQQFDVYGGGGATLRNLANAEFRIAGDVGMKWQLTEPRPSFDNGGLFAKTAGAGVANVDWLFANRNVLEARSGTLQFTQGVRQLAGQTVVAENAVLDTPLLDVTGGTVLGRGKIQGNVRLANAIMEPGDSPGRLTVTGNTEFLTGSALRVEIGGLLPGANYDQLVDAGSLSLGGSLSVNLLDAFTPQFDDQFTIATAAAVMGKFANALQNYTLPNGSTFDVIYNPTSVVLTHFQSIPEPATVWGIGWVLLQLQNTRRHRRANYRWAIVNSNRLLT